MLEINEIIYIVKPDKNNINKYVSYSFLDTPVYIVDKDNFDSYEEAEFFIKEQCKPLYHKEFGSNYYLTKEEPNSERMQEIDKRADELLEWFDDIESKPIFKIEKFLYNTKYKLYNIGNIICRPIGAGILKVLDYFGL